MSKKKQEIKETEASLNEQIVSKMKQYHDTIDVMNRVQERALHEQIKALKMNLAGLLCKGAKDCSCGGFPSGMLKRAAIIKDDLVDKPSIYAIHCSECSKVALGNDTAAAVAKWNSLQSSVKIE
jgi:hypothetical protein